MGVKVNLLQTKKGLYKAKVGKFELVTVPPQKYLIYAGRGNPYDNEEFSRAVASLFAASEKLRGHLVKGRKCRDYSLMPLECLWYSNRLRELDYSRKENWSWQLMMGQPDKASLTVSISKKLNIARKIKLKSVREGLVVQTLHRGPYTTEKPTFDLMLSFIYHEGYRPDGALHEIYLSNPLKTMPDDLKTLVRRPVKRKTKN